MAGFGSLDPTMPLPGSEPVIDADAARKLLSGLDLSKLLGMPSFATQANEQRKRDEAALQSGGVPALMAETERTQELAGGFAGSTTPAVGGVFGALSKAPPFVSAAQKAVESSPMKVAPAEQWVGTLRNTPGVKPEELDRLSLDALLGRGKEPVSKEQMLEHIEANKTKVGEVIKSGEPDWSRLDQAGRAQVMREFQEFIGGRDAFLREYPTHTEQQEGVRRWYADFGQGEGGSPKFADYQLPGGENYRERLLTLTTEKDPNIRGPQDPESIQTRLAHIKAQRDAVNEIAAREDRGGFLTTAERGRLTVLDEEEKRLNKFLETAKPVFKTSHWDEPNVLVHYRANDRMLPEPGTGGGEVYVVQNTRSGNRSQTFKTWDEAEKYRATLPETLRGEGTRIIPVTEPPKQNPTLFLEEIQSDWHQAGRRRGYQVPEDPSVYAIEGNGPWVIRNTRTGAMEHDFNNKQTAEGYLRDIKLGKILPWRGNEGVPDAPFKKTWPELALKRAIREAVDNGQTQIAWTPGHVQAERYDLSKHVNLLSVAKQPDGRFLTYVEGKDGEALFRGRDGWSDHGQKTMTAKELEDTVGKDIAKKAIEGKPNKDGWVDIRDENLKVGGEGMAGFYDEILPAAANKLGKKYGAKVEQTDLRGVASPVKANRERDVTVEHPPMDRRGRPVDPDAQYRVVDSETGELLGTTREYEVAQRMARQFQVKPTKVHVMKITPELAAAAKAGFPLFSAGALMLGGQEEKQ